MHSFQPHGDICNQFSTPTLLRSQAWSHRDRAKLMGTWRLHPCKRLMLMVPQSSWEIKTERKWVREFSKHTAPAREGRSRPLPVLSGLQILTCCHKPNEAEFTHTAKQLFSWHSSCITHVWCTEREGSRGDARGTACLLLQRASRCSRALERQIKLNPVHVPLERNKHRFVYRLHFFILYLDALWTL